MTDGKLKAVVIYHPSIQSIRARQSDLFGQGNRKYWQSNERSLR
jgi:hypothetical protein